jgi:hypothetical protein
MGCLHISTQELNRRLQKSEASRAKLKQSLVRALCWSYLYGERQGIAHIKKGVSRGGLGTARVCVFMCMCVCVFVHLYMCVCVCVLGVWDFRLSLKETGRIKWGGGSGECVDGRLEG